MQSSYQDKEGATSFKIRTQQIDLLRKFIDEKTAADTFPVVVLGDFNVDARREHPHKIDSAEYASGSLDVYLLKLAVYSELSSDIWK